MVKVGVIGLGMMGNVHLDAYAKRDDAEVIAISDKSPKLLSGEARTQGNIEGQDENTFDYDSVRKYDEGMDLINDPEVELVDVCLPTPLHFQYASAVLDAGKHLMVEKPLERNSEQAFELAKRAENAKGLAMVGMCLRFWPGWTWLKEQVEQGTYGKVLFAQFRRVATHPGGNFYLNGEMSGGAILDLHIHDTDFVQHCFGRPEAVTSFGYSNRTSEPDHVVTHYHYDNGPQVVAEGSWAMHSTFPFNMQFTVNFEEATAVYDLAAENTLTLYHGDEPQVVPLDEAMGYDFEIGYFLDCIGKGEAPTTVTLEDGAWAVKIVEAERESILSGKRISL